MNKIGHTSQAAALLPFIVLAPLYYNFDNIAFQYMKTIMNGFIHTPNIIIGLSLLCFWIGSTIIDFIDFKIIKPMMPKEKQEKHYYYHRQWTHGLIPNICLLVLSFVLIHTSNTQFAYLFLFLMLGIMTHLIGDFFTGSIPIFFYAPYNAKGGRIGINRITPSFFRPFFSQVLPKFADTWLVSTALFMFSVYMFKELNGDKYFNFF